MIKYFIIIMISLLFLLAISSFKLNIETEFSPEEMQEINQEVEERVAAFAAKETSKCRKKLLEEANAAVDTLLMFNAPELLGTDTLASPLPPKPNRPKKPEILTPVDDSPLQPLINNEDTIF